MAKLQDFYQRLRKKLKKMDERTSDFHRRLSDESYEAGYEAGWHEGRQQMWDYLKKEA
jgi:hypothetical protein